MYLYPLLVLLFFVVLELYFKVAERYGFVDHPNQRSSHETLTIRGGGVIYLIAGIAVVILVKGVYFPVAGLFLIGAVSLLDDKFSLSQKMRLLAQLFSVAVLFYSLDYYAVLPIWSVFLLFILCLGFLNAYNFMDGINGMNGLYSLVAFGTLYWIDTQFYSFASTPLIVAPALATLVFLFYNFRLKAKCFAGDVGSIGVAFWLIWLMLVLFRRDSNYSFILFFAVYGVDSILTIIHRIYLKQNIFKAHRLHLYQILTNEAKISQLKVSTGYAIVQLGINAVILYSGLDTVYLYPLILIPLILIYLLVKPRFLKS